MPLDEIDPEDILSIEIGGQPVRFQHREFEMPSDESIRAFSRWMAEQVALSARIRRERQLAPMPCSSTHTMIVLHDGEVIYNKYPDKVMPPRIFG